MAKYENLVGGAAPPSNPVFATVDRATWQMYKLLFHLKLKNIFANTFLDVMTLEVGDVSRGKPALPGQK